MTYELYSTPGKSGNQNSQLVDIEKRISNLEKNLGLSKVIYYLFLFLFYWIILYLLLLSFLGSSNSFDINISIIRGKNWIIK